MGENTLSEPAKTVDTSRRESEGVSSPRRYSPAPTLHRYAPKKLKKRDFAIFGGGGVLDGQFVKSVGKSL